MHNKKIESILEKLLKSDEFSGATNYQRLLQYLVKSSLDGESPKESTIAYEVFGKSAEAVSGSDTTVRVYIHNLRKKLDSYYQHEGKDDKMHLEIPKGHYRVELVDVGKNQQKSRPRFFLVLNIVVLGFLLLLNYFFLRNAKEKNSAFDFYKKDAVWADFIKSDHPSLLVIGDYYLYRDRSLPGRPRYVRDPQINSGRDLEEFLTNHRDMKDIIFSSHTLLGKFAPWSLYDILPIFFCNDARVELKLSTNLQWENLNRYNLIFFGSFKNLGNLMTVLRDLHLEYQIYPNRLDYYDERTDSTFSYRASKEIETEYVRDYGVVAKLPGPNQNSILIIASTHDVGPISMVRFLSQQKSLREFEDKYFPGTVTSNYFVAIFEVQGFQRSGFNPKLLHFQSISRDYKISLPH